MEVGFESFGIPHIIWQSEEIALGIKICSCCGFLKQGYPPIIHFNGIFLYKPFILGIPHIWKPPYMFHRFDMTKVNRISLSCVTSPKFRFKTGPLDALLNSSPQGTQPDAIRLQKNQEPTPQDLNHLSVRINLQVKSVSVCWAPKIICNINLISILLSLLQGRFGGCPVFRHNHPNILFCLLHPSFQSDINQWGKNKLEESQ